MSRRLGCTLKTLSQWEADDVAPSENLSDQLDFLQRQLESHSDKLVRTPVAEALMSYLKITQIHFDEVETTLAENVKIFKHEIE